MASDQCSRHTGIIWDEPGRSGVGGGGFGHIFNDVLRSYYDVYPVYTNRSSRCCYGVATACQGIATCTCTIGPDNNSGAPFCHYG